MKIVVKILVGLIVLVLLVIAALLIFRGVRQTQIAKETRIAAPNGIDEAKYVDINGAQEWITIRGEDRSAPVILFLHGGPSEANSPFPSLYLPYEKHYVFVQWDQPGAGKTYIKAGKQQPKLTLDSMASDGIAVVESVRQQLHPPKVILIGQDWGGVLGIRMIEQRPDLFNAFVGTGQLVGMFAGQSWQYDYALEHATAAHDEKILAALKRIGAPPYRTLELYGQFQGCCRNPFWAADDVAAMNRMRVLLVDSPALSMSDVLGYVDALRTNEVKLDQLLMTLDDLRTTDTKFVVPVFFIQGANDNVSPTSLVADYATKLEAPAKKVDVIPNAGHFVLWTHPQEFLARLDADLVTATAATAGTVIAR
jgi:pimeloyl-ACP methyl ester carboxylesterase